MNGDANADLDDAEIWSICKLGHRLYARGRLRDARKIFDGLVALDDELEYPWHALGLIARKRDNPARAEECLRRRLELDPEADASRVQLAEVLYELDRLEGAIRLLDYFCTTDRSTGRAARRGRVLRDRWT